MFYFGTNFKMHGTAEQTRKFVRALAPHLSKDQEVQCFVLPPVTSLQGLSEHASYLWLGAQNMHWANEGAYTGEISPVMLRALEVDLVMLGHAERRHDFGETDEIIAKKVKSALRHGLKVLLCVGETLKQRAQEVDQEVVTVQLKIALQGTSRADTARLLIAYEPVWTIGEGGREAEPEEVRENVRGIRQTLHTLFGAQSQAIPILYGGSVNERNCAAYARLPEVDGLFVGRAAWTVGGFLSVLQCLLEARVQGVQVSERSI